MLNTLIDTMYQDLKYKEKQFIDGVKEAILHSSRLNLRCHRIIARSPQLIRRAEMRNVVKKCQNVMREIKTCCSNMITGAVVSGLPHS